MTTSAQRGFFTSSTAVFGLLTAATIATGACAPGRDASSDTAAAGSTATAGRPVTGQTTQTGFDRPIDSVSSEDLNAYASRLQFVTDPLLSDEQAMLSRTGTTEAARPGPTARIEAERGAASLSELELERGRIIARVVSSGPYAPLGLARGANYLWVDRRGGAWRAVMIPAAAQSPRKLLSLRRGDMRHESSVPAARWFHFPEVGMVAWGNCGKRCCIPCEPPGFECPDVGQFLLGPEGVLPPGPRNPRPVGPGAGTTPRGP